YCPESAWGGGRRDCDGPQCPGRAARSHGGPGDRRHGLASVLEQPRPDVHRGRGQGHLLLVRSHIGGSLVSLLRSLRFLLDPFRQPRSTPRPARPRHRSGPALEELETRLPPATLLNPNIVTYQDVDGDKVTVTLSKPLLTSHAVADQVFDFDSGDTSSGDA